MENDNQTPTRAPTNEAPTNADQEAPPSGLSYRTRAGKKKPYFAEWREAGGKKKARTFASIKDRAAFAETWAKHRAKWGTGIAAVNPREAEAWRVASQMTGGINPIELATHWLKTRKEVGGEMLIKDAVAKFMVVRAGMGLARDSFKHVETHLARLVGVLGDQKFKETNADQLAQWIDGLRDPETKAKFEPYTLRHHVKSLKSFFAYAQKRRWTDDNPAELIEPPKIEAEEVTVLAIEDAEKLFAVNRDNPCIGRLALEAFGGLRFTSAARLSRNELLDGVEKGVVMPGAKHKSGRRQYVDGYPANLWAWIERAPAACWNIKQRQYLDLKAEAFEAAEVNNPGNVLRHSFCSYHIAVNADAARTAVLLTHSNPKMLYQHYKGKASKQDGERYFRILP